MVQVLWAGSEDRGDGRGRRSHLAGQQAEKQREAEHVFSVDIARYTAHIFRVTDL